MNILIICLLFGIITCLLTIISRVLLLRFNIVDIPKSRGMHKMPIPRGGGISIIISVSLYLIFFDNNNLISQSNHIYGLLVGIGLLGFIDDLKDINFKYRLILQFSFSVIIICLFSIINVYSYLDIKILILLNLILVIYFVWQINLFNFMDGINGIASIQAILFFLSMSVIAFINGYDYFVQKYLIFAFILFGFLPQNFPKARIFLGDGGSYFLGAFIAFSTIESLYIDEKFFCMSIILMASFYLDSTITLLSRIIQKKEFFEAHKEHLYQLMTRLNKSHSVTVLFLFIFNVVIATIGYLFIYILDVKIFIFLISYLSLLSILYLLFKRNLHYKVIQKNL